MLVLELVLMVGVVLFGWFGMDSSLMGMLAKGGTAVVRSAAEVRGEAVHAFILYAIGMLAMTAGRMVSLKRGRGNIASPFIIPGAALAATIGFVLQIGYGNPVMREFWP